MVSVKLVLIAVIFIVGKLHCAQTRRLLSEIDDTDVLTWDQLLKHMDNISQMGIESVKQWKGQDSGATSVSGLVENNHEMALKKDDAAGKYSDRSLFQLILDFFKALFGF